MEYKGFTITAEVESYDNWSIDEDGRPVEHIDALDGFEVTGYFFDNDELDINEFETMSETSGEMLKEIVDGYLERIKA